MAALLPRPLPAYTGRPAAPARDAPSRLVRRPNCTWPGCSGAPSAVARSPLAQPRRTLRPEQAASSRWVTRGRRRRPDSWVFPTGGSLGLAEAVRPSSIGPWRGPLLSYTLPGYSGRRQQPAGPAHRALRPRHAPSSICDAMGVPLPRSPAACSGASPVGASPAAFPPSRSPPPRTGAQRT